MFISIETVSGYETSRIASGRRGRRFKSCLPDSPPANQTSREEMFISQGTMRFFIESLRDGNPFEYAWWAIYKGPTISQNIGIYMVIVGLSLFIIFYKSEKKCHPERSRGTRRSTSP